MQFSSQAAQMYCLCCGDFSFLLKQQGFGSIVTEQELAGDRWDRMQAQI